MAFLSMSPGDARVMQAVLERAAKLRNEHDTRLADYTAGKVAEFVVPPLAKAMSATLVAIARAMRG